MPGSKVYIVHIPMVFTIAVIIGSWFYLGVTPIVLQFPIPSKNRVSKSGLKAFQPCSLSRNTGSLPRTDAVLWVLSYHVHHGSFPHILTTGARFVFCSYKWEEFWPVHEGYLTWGLSFGPIGIDGRHQGMEIGFLGWIEQPALSHAFLFWELISNAKVGKFSCTSYSWAF